MRAKRPARSARRKKSQIARGLVATSIMSAAKVASSTSHATLVFNRPVIAGNPVSPGSTDVNFTGTSATTRHAISTQQLDFVTVKTALSGALTGSKTYTVTIAPDQGLIVPANGKWDDLTASFSTT